MELQLLKGALPCELVVDPGKVRKVEKIESNNTTVSTKASPGVLVPTSVTTTVEVRSSVSTRVYFGQSGTAHMPGRDFPAAEGDDFEALWIRACGKSTCLAVRDLNTGQGHRFLDGESYVKSVLELKGVEWGVTVALAIITALLGLPAFAVAGTGIGWKVAFWGLLVVTILGALGKVGRMVFAKGSTYRENSYHAFRSALDARIEGFVRGDRHE